MEKTLLQKEMCTSESGQVIHLEYYLCTQVQKSETHYGVKIVAKVGDEVHESTVEDISTTLDTVQNMIGLLARCGVTPIAFRDVLDDIML